jgi:hypothetical protein
MQQAEPYSLLVDPAWQQPVFTMLFVGASVGLANAIAGFVDVIAGFADEVFSRRGDGRCQRSKQPIFINNGHCL